MLDTITQECKDLIDAIPLSIRINHQLVVHHSIKNKDEPILFHVESELGSDTKLYIWHPTYDEKVAMKVLDLLHATLVPNSIKMVELHRTLVQSLITMLLNTSELGSKRNKAQLLLTDYFGTHKLGSMKQVVRPSDLRKQRSGEIDFYLLPLRLNAYTWLGQ